MQCSKYVSSYVYNDLHSPSLPHIQYNGLWVLYWQRKGKKIRAQSEVPTFDISAIDRLSTRKLEV